MPLWFKLVGYPTWFVFAFLSSVYATLPVGMLKGTIKDAGEKALGKGTGKVGRHGVDPEITIGTVGLYRVSGLAFERLSVQLPSKDPDPGPVIDIDELNVRVGLFSLLTGSPSVTFNGRIWSGEFDGNIDIDSEKKTPTLIDVELEGLKLESSPLILSKVGVPLTGLANVKVDLNLGGEPNKDGEGNVDINVTKLSLGPGERKIPMFGSFSVPLIDLGALTGQIVFEKGQGASKDLKLAGGADANAEFDVSISLSKKPAASRLNGGGSFLIEEKFLEDNPKFGTLLSFELPGLSFKKSKDSEDRYHFLLRGTVQDPRPSLSRKAGKDRSKGGGKASRRARKAK